MSRISGGYPPSGRPWVPEAVKIVIFEAIKIKTKNRSKMKWNHKKHVLGSFPNDLLATRGHPKGILRAPQKIFTTPAKFFGYPGTPKHCPFLYKQVPNFKLKKIKEGILFCLNFFRDSWGP